jgi:hypothetical protein
VSISYADYEFYTDEYHGTDFSTSEEALPYLQKASDAVRRAIRYKDELEPPTPFQKEHLKRAVCLAADFLLETGNNSGASANGLSGYSIGDVNMQIGGTSDVDMMATYGVPQRAYDELIVTGYLYRGI